MENNIGGGLILPEKKDKRFSFGAVFGYDFTNLPENFRVGEPLEIKNQLDSDLCVAFSTASAREFQEGKKLSPEYIFKQLKKIEGSLDWGSNPKYVAKAIQDGILEKAESPYSLEKDGRDFVANWENWALLYDQLAEKHKTQGVFWVGENGSISMFDAIRGSLWRFRQEKRAIVLGAEWREVWTKAEQGRIPLIYMEYSGIPHAFVCIGWEKNDLILQLSNGEKIGNKGLFYMPKSVVNKEILFAFMCADYPEGQTKETILIRSDWSRSGFFGKTLIIIKQLLFLWL